MKTKNYMIMGIVLMTMLVLSGAASAATTGPNYPDVGASVTGVGTIAWLNPTRIIADDTNYATASVSQDGAITNYLKGTDYDFTIPAGATINGITVEINRQSTGQTSPFVRDYVVKLVDRNGNIVGNNKAATGTNWPTSSLQTATYGGTSDTWGAGLTYEDINSINFGVVLSATNPNTDHDRTATVDYIRVTITYTPQCTSGVCCDTVNQVFKAAGTSCRASAGACDIAETCTGSSASCPADAKSTAQCRASAGDCDVAENCDGTHDTCPTDGFLSPSTMCRASAGDCDVAETCTGTGPNCPANVFQPTGTSCNDGLWCSEVDECDGNGACVQDTARDCSDGDSETYDSCDEENNVCLNTDVIENDDGGSVDFGPSETGGNGDKFEDSEDVYIMGSDWGCDTVDIYVTEDQTWSDGTAAGTIVKSFTDEPVSGGAFTVIWDGDETPVGLYDVLVECDGAGDPQEYNPSAGDVVDGLTIEGFEVLPEPVTIALLGLGVASMAGYFGISRKRR